MQTIINLILTGISSLCCIWVGVGFVVFLLLGKDWE